MPPRLAYGSFMVLALAVFLLARHVLPKSAALTALPVWKRLALPLAAFSGGVLGAKLPFALGSQSWWSAAAWLGDGKTIVTGLAAAYLAVEITKLALGIRIKTGDTFALPLALALTVGRWGCFFNGCCYGTQTTLPWGVDFGDGLLRHPIQIYESLFHFGLALMLWQIMSHNALRYQCLKLYLIAYALYRFGTEYIRPEPVWWLGMTFYQCAALVLMLALTLQWLVDARLSSNPEPGSAGLRMTRARRTRIASGRSY
jgi:phosphatidylglycerol---prolipoprotein diacylglyceryl transferase